MVGSMVSEGVGVVLAMTLGELFGSVDEVRMFSLV